MLCILAHVFFYVYTVPMQLKRHMVHFDTARDATSDELLATKSATKGQRLFPFLLLAMMLCAFLLLDAVLPLEGFWFHTALLTQTGSWALLPTHVLFPGWGITSSIHSLTSTPPSVALSWRQIPLLLTAIVVVFLVYCFALRRLSRTRASLRYILLLNMLARPAVHPCSRRYLARYIFVHQLCTDGSDLSSQSVDNAADHYS